MAEYTSIDGETYYGPIQKTSRILANCCTGLCCRRALGVVGAVLIAAGAVFFVYFPAIVQYGINQQAPIRENSESFQLWSTLPMPLKIYIYFFNITNYKEFSQNHEKPIVKELGPYVYSEKWIKHNITFNSNGTVSYRETKTFWFEPTLSSGKDTDRIYTINIPMVSAANMFKYAGPILKVVLTTIFKMAHESVIVNATVRQLTFDGYDDTIMKLFKELMPNAKYPYDKFAFFYKKNGSSDGLFNVFTGENDIKNFLKIDHWNGKKFIDNWEGDSCNMINGTVGEIFAPNIDITKPLRFFLSDFCRSFWMEYSHPTERFGISGVRFEITPSAFANSSINPDNACFCTGRCLPSGVFNASTCKFGAPIAVSLPHFLLGDRRYQNSIEGLKPNKSRHLFYYDLEPQTGIPMDIQARLQINAVIERIPGIEYFEHLNNTIFPVLWFTQTAEISPRIVELLEKATKTSYLYGKILYYGLFAVGAVLLVSSAVYYIILTRKRKDES